MFVLKFVAIETLWQRMRFDARFYIGVCWFISSDTSWCLYNVYILATIAVLFSAIILTHFESRNSIKDFTEFTRSDCNSLGWLIVAWCVCTANGTKVFWSSNKWWEEIKEGLTLLVLAPNFSILSHGKKLWILVRERWVYCRGNDRLETIMLRRKRWSIGHLYVKDH